MFWVSAHVIQPPNVISHLLGSFIMKREVAFSMIKSRQLTYSCCEIPAWRYTIWKITTKKIAQNCWAASTYAPEKCWALIKAEVRAKSFCMVKPSTLEIIHLLRRMLCGRHYTCVISTCSQVTDRSKYEKMAADDKVRYEKAMAKYNKGGTWTTPSIYSVVTS